MMDGKSDAADKGYDDFTMPGFRFHPTDEELVGFYLKRKLQLRPLPVELIKQVDIYKYDPWDLPKLASTGEKEWYFYCPRDRKYRNSTRPNRVTGSGFWKATGTDRPIYSSDGAKCIGLKKSLVFYRGRAAKGVKTDWMMHEFRLPSTVDAAQAQTVTKKILDKNLPPNESWAICRIFKKTTSMANRALSHSLAVSTSPDGYYNTHHNQFIYSENISSTTQNDFQQEMSLSAINMMPSFKAIASASNKPSMLTSSSSDYFPESLVFSEEVSGTSNKSTPDFTSMLFNLSPAFSVDRTSESINIEMRQQQLNGHSVDSSNAMQTSINMENEQAGFRKNQSTTHTHHQWGNVDIGSIGFPFSLPSTAQGSWDSPPCPSEISSTNYSTNKCYT